MTGLVVDLVIVAILLLFFFLGWRKGLLLSLCGLVVVVVSFFGATVVADLLDEPLADAIQPRIEALISRQVEQRMDDLGIQLPEGVTPGALLEKLPELDGVELPQWALDALDQAGIDLDALIGSSQSSGDAPTAADTPTSGGGAGLLAGTAHAAAVQISHGVILLVAFIALNLLLTLALHALDLVARLPGLRFCNGLGGGVLGLAKGVLILFVVVSVLKVTSLDLIPLDALEGSFLLQFLIDPNPILSLVQP